MLEGVLKIRTRLFSGGDETRLESATSSFPFDQASPPAPPSTVSGAFIDRQGELVVTLTNGEAKKLGAVVGRDGENVNVETVKALVKAEVDAIPRPKDGLDGVNFDDMDINFDTESKELLITAVRGENAKQWKFFVPMLTDQGVYKEGTDYLKSDGVTFGGSFWIAQKDTSAKPGTNEDWRLAVKKGRDGKDRPVEPKGPSNSVELGGK